MKRRTPPVVAALAVAVALPVIAQADHKPGHQKPPGPQADDLTIGARPNPTVFPRATVISGSLKGPDNGGKAVVLYQDQFPFGPDFTNVATTTTDSKGDYRFTRNPTRNTRYQAIASTGGVYGLPASSQVLVVGVRIRMSLRVGDSTPRVGQIVRFRGRACPAHDGLRVRIQRRTRKGTYRTVRRTRLRAATRCSIYSRRVRIFRDGTYRVTSDDVDHERGFSRARSLNTPR